MFGWFESQSTLTAEQRAWIDDRFAWLRNEFGEKRLRGVVVTPTDEFFPDRYEPTADGAETLLDRLCGYMDVDRKRVTLRLYSDPAADPVAAAFNPGLPREFALGAFQEDDEQIVIWLERSRLTEPHSVVSTLAHELGHVHLLADKHCDQNTPDHEPLTDLLTVYFGLGVFVANTSIREAHWHSGNVSGWSVGRQGYLTIPDYAYALAFYARARGESRPAWVKYLRPDLRVFFKTESRRLASGTVISAAGSASTMTTMADKSPAAKTANSEERSPSSEIEDEPERAEDSVAEEPGFRSDEGATWLFTQGTFYAAEGRHERAVEAFSRVLQANPRDSEAWLLRAQSLLALGQFNAAIDDCSWSLAYEPEGVAAQCCRAQAYLWLRRFDLALNDLNQARRIEKRDPQIYYLRGLAHLGLGNNRKAIADLKRARRFAPTWADIYLARSRAYRALGKTKHAEADLAEAIRREPEYADTAIREASLAGRPFVEVPES